MADLESFKRDVQDFLAEYLPDVLRVGNSPDVPEDELKAWIDALARRRWLAPGWPTEYGGGGLDDQHRKVLRAELRAARAPNVADVGITLLGPALLDFGTEDQKRAHLPEIASGARRWCQGFSEPSSGSDLASLRTRAILEGEEYVVNGSKIWTTGATEADWIFCLVRTDPDAPKQQGISLLLIDMDQPGVKVAPLRLINGTEHFCQVFFDNARAGVNQVVGPLNEGWSVAKRILQYERETEGNDEIAGELDETVAELVKREVGLENAILADPALRERLAAHEIDERALELTMLRAVQEARAGQTGRDISSVGKFRWGDMRKDGFDIAMDAAGSAGLGWEGPGFLPIQLEATRAWLFSRAHSIWGGTHEIQKNIIAKRVLDIPED